MFPSLHSKDVHSCKHGCWDSENKSRQLSTFVEEPWHLWSHKLWFHGSTSIRNTIESFWTYVCTKRSKGSERANKDGQADGIVSNGLHAFQDAGYLWQVQMLRGDHHHLYNAERWKLHLLLPQRQERICWHSTHVVLCKECWGSHCSSECLQLLKGDELFRAIVLWELHPCPKHEESVQVSKTNGWNYNCTPLSNYTRDVT